MKICFVAQQIYPYFSKESKAETAGGAELQQVFIGKGLRDKGYDVSYISMDYGQKNDENLDGLTIYKSFKPNEGLFGIRFFYPRLYKIWKALKRADADMYYVRSATFLPGIVALFCKKYNKKYVFAGAHDTNFISGNLRLPTKRDEILYRFGVKNANAIIVQSEKQKKLLMKTFNRKGKVIRNFFPFKIKKIPFSKRTLILWVSTIKSWKRPERFVNLAREFPNEKFVMIGGRPSGGNKLLFEKIVKDTDKIENIEFLGFKPFEITENYFDRCKVFINTSEYEGFPNTFLQAWSRGVPVISYVDPDGVIKQNRLGLVVSDEMNLPNVLNSFFSSDNWDDEAILQYFIANHSDNVIEEFDSFFKEVVQIN